MGARLPRLRELCGRDPRRSPDQGLIDGRVRAWARFSRSWFLCAQAFAIGLANYLQNAMFGISGERFTLKVRTMLFRAILHKEMAWFDQPANSSGALASRLSSDAAAIQGLTGPNLGLVTATVSTLAAGLAIAFAASWRLALVVLGTLPLVRGRGRVIAMHARIVLI